MPKCRKQRGHLLVKLFLRSSYFDQYVLYKDLSAYALAYVASSYLQWCETSVPDL